MIIVWGLYQYQQKLQRGEEYNSEDDEYNKDDNNQKDNQDEDMSEQVSNDEISFTMSDIGSIQTADTYSMELGSMTNGDSSLADDSSG
jgi:hypothetical protein